MNTIEVSPIKIDKISLVGRFPLRLNKYIISYFQSYLGELGKEGKALGSHPGKAKLGFKFAINIDVYGLPVKHKEDKNAGCLLVQIGPKQACKDYTIRFEFNPDAIGPEGVKKVNEIFESLRAFINSHDEYPDFWERFNVTRIDVAIDLNNGSLEDFIFNNAMSKKWKVYPTQSLEGKKYMETMNLGGVEGAKRLCVYDKKEELRKNKGIHLQNERTRIEFRLKLSKPISKLMEINNPFLTLGIFDVRALEEGNKNDWRWIQFIDSVRCRGLNGALNLIPKQTRRDYRKKLENAAGVEWWNPERVWKTFPEALQKAGLTRFDLVAITAKV